MQESNLASIYIIGPREGPYKVGYSKDPQVRLSNIQVASPVDVFLLYTQETEEDKAKTIEKLIHRQISLKRLRGEWFSIALEDLIAEVKFAFIRWEDEESLTFRFKRKLI